MDRVFAPPLEGHLRMRVFAGVLEGSLRRRVFASLLEGLTVIFIISNPFPRLPPQVFPTLLSGSIANSFECLSSRAHFSPGPPPGLPGYIRVHR